MHEAHRGEVEGRSADNKGTAKKVAPKRDREIAKVKIEEGLVAKIGGQLARHIERQAPGTRPNPWKTT